MLVDMSRSTLVYENRRRDDSAVRKRIKEIAQTRVRYGSDRIHMLLRREGWPDNHKRVRRIYREEGLNIRSRRPRKAKSAAHRMERPLLSNLDQCWSMDFVHDQLISGRKIRGQIGALDAFLFQQASQRGDGDRSEPVGLNDRVSRVPS